MIPALLLAFLGQSPVPPPTAFVGVDVLPMDRDELLRDQTVVVREGKIAALGPSKDVAVPEDALRIDGRGRVLMPGLADMHVHSWDDDDLLLFVANGVTTVRNMFGSPMHVRWRKEIADGELLGPTIVTAGPIIDGDPPVWPGSTVLVDPADAEKVVLEQKEAGYDFLKVYEKLSRETYDAVVAAAKKHGMRVMGHVPRSVDLAHAIESGQKSIEHLDGWAEAAQADDSPHRGPVSLRDEGAAWKHVDAKKIAASAEAAAKAGTWNCPTLVVYQKWVVADEMEAMLARPEMKYASPMLRTFWDPKYNYLGKMPAETIRSLRDSDVDRKRTVGILHANGARILLGTDMGNPFVVPGFSLHEELANLVASGLSPYEALRAGTSGAAEFLGESESWGSVAVGRRADLLLLEADPRTDVANAARRVGVMTRGRWLSEADLHGRLEELAAKYRPEAPK